jgi:iron complex outermembrane receptor protein
MRKSIACALVAIVLASASAAAWTASADDPVPAWQQRLATYQTQLRQVAASDTAAIGRLSNDVAGLRQDVLAFLASFAPAQRDTRPWLAPRQAGSATLADLAGGMSELRAVLSRIVAASTAGEADGAFYLGRMDVAVSAESAVTATSDAAPAGAVVVDAQAIESHDRVALAGALALAPGVTFSRVGNRNESTVYVRGFDIRQVPIFVDGIPVYTPYDGYADLERFTTFDMAELQVSKGFTSVIYGANALGGAINVVSRRPANRLEGIVGASLGSGQMRTAFANLGSRASSWYLQGGGSYLTADHVQLSDAFLPAKTEDGGARENSYRRDGKFNIKFGFTPDGRDEYAISYVGQRAKKGNPPYAGSDSAVRVRYWQWPYWDKDSLYLVSNTGLGKAGYVRIRVFHDIYRNALYSYDDATYSTQLKPSAFKSPYHDYTTGGSAEWASAFAGRHTLRVAAHVKQDDHKEHNIGEPSREQQGWITSISAEDSVVLGARLSLVAGVGFDRQTTTRAQGFEQGAIVDLPRGTTSGLNPQVGVFWATPSGMLRLTLSRKTRLPSMKDRFSYKFGTAVPNPLLNPERATTLETGYQGALGSRTSLQASVFYSRIGDLVQRYPLAANVFQQRNIGRASSAGFEVDVRSRLATGIELAGNYSYLTRSNLSDPAVPLVETPKHKGIVSLTAGPFGGVQGMISVDYEAGRRTLNEVSRYFDVPSFAILNAKLSWTVWRQVSLDVSAVNLTDRNYWIADGYPEAGRMVRFATTWRF